MFNMFSNFLMLIPCTSAYDQGAVLYMMTPFLCFFPPAKVPFPMTFRFKPMLQRGVDLITLDASWFVLYLSTEFPVRYGHCQLLTLLITIFFSLLLYECHFSYAMPPCQL